MENPMMEDTPEPDPVYRFAEPETRWETFISGKSLQANRNVQIWLDAARRLGLDKRGS